MRLKGHLRLAFHCCDYSHQADFSHTSDFVKKITTTSLRKRIAKRHCAECEYTAEAKRSRLKASVSAGRQTPSGWKILINASGSKWPGVIFWMTGNFVNFDKGEDNDEWAIANNYVSVVPCQFDLSPRTSRFRCLTKEWNILG